jgi:hypothetical protein
MKKLFLFVAMIPALSFAQVDSSKFPITLQLKVKHVAYMGAELSKSNTLNDIPVRDSLIKYIGSGTLPDSIVNVRLKAGVILRLVQAILDEQTGAGYVYLYEMANNSVAQAGLIAQLVTKAQGASSEKGIGIWLYNSVLDWFNRKQAVLTEKIINGRDWLKNPLTYN